MPLAPSNTPPTVLIHEDVCFESSCLSSLVRDVGGAAVGPSEMGTRPRNADLWIVDASGFSDLESALGDDFNANGERPLPVLGVLGVIGELERGYLPLAKLARMGLVGLIDRRAKAEQIRACLRELLYGGVSRRGARRAPCCLPVTLESRGVRSEEFITSLSVGGAGLATRREIAEGEAVSLRWAIGEGADATIEVSGRVVHQRASVRDDADWEFGVSFDGVSERARAVLEEQVGSILDALGCLDFDLESARPDGCVSPPTTLAARAPEPASEPPRGAR